MDTWVYNILNQNNGIATLEVTNLKKKIIKLINPSIYIHANALWGLNIPISDLTQFKTVLTL